MSTSPELVVICGATASRKSELALALARERRGELVCCDSVQMVEGFVIGAASPSAQEYAEAPHHLFQSVSWDDPPDAGRYQRMADAAIAEIRARGGLPIVVGGTGLYLKSLLFGLANIPDVPAYVRELLTLELAESGPDAMFARLQDIDPTVANNISGGARNTQRVLRALEVAVHTGRPLSSYWEDQPKGPRYRARLLMPGFETAALSRRISRRVGQMLEDGFVAEVKDLLAKGVDPDCRAMKSLGYREIVEHLGGVYGLDTAREQIERGHRRYARRQRTWFKAVDDVHRLDASADDLLARALAIVDA